ncbi:MAG: hypothetical protein ACXIUV_11410 [Alkalilacustris sp.]
MALGVSLSGAFLAGAAIAATQTAPEFETLLSTDGFGECVPEERLDDIWLVFATKGKSGRVPHVCMSGDCEDLPDIAGWASAQQFPDDIDLEREDVVARYAAFVAEFCAPQEEPPEPEVLGVTVTDVPALAQSLPRLLGPGEIRPNIPQRTLSSVPGFSGVPGVLGRGGGRNTGPERPRPDLPEVANPLLPPTSPPPDVENHVPLPPIPLPAGLWLLISALGVGVLVHRRARRA